jgi:colicin import membrane protein
MEAFLVETRSDKLTVQQWRNMLILSAVMHMAIFSLLLFVPEASPTRRIGSTIYEVNLVEMPTGRPLKVVGQGKPKADKQLSGSRKPIAAKRIPKREKKAKPIVIAKRTMKTEMKKPEEPKVSSPESIEQALLRIKEKVDEKRKDRIERQIAELEARVQETAGTGLTGADADSGITIRIYQMEVENRIKDNWSYPVALLGPKSEKDLEAIVVVRVRNNGTILKFWFKRESSNVMFNQSVLKAIERSDPLPQFPEGYRKTDDEIEINFNLRDLEGD